MQALICREPFKLDYRNIEKPRAATGRSIIKVKRFGICGTDLHAYEGTQPYFTYPRILGHELAGEIVETDAEGFVPGDHVTIIPYYNCGNCIACQNNKPNCCSSLQVAGVHIDGGMCEYLSVPSSSLVAAEGLSLDALTLVEPLAIGAHAISRSDIIKGEFVCVIGAGPIGLGVIQFAQIAGARVIVIDINQDRLGFCQSHLKVEHIINPSVVDSFETITSITASQMASLVIDATGNLTAINNAFQLLSHTGRFVLVGLQKESISINHPEFHKREATLMSSRNATRADFMHVIHSIQKKQVNPSLYITHRLQFGELAEKFASLTDPANKVIKAVVEL